jgi:hypothetical protein
MPLQIIMSTAQIISTGLASGFAAAWFSNSLPSTKGEVRPSETSSASTVQSSTVAYEDAWAAEFNSVEETAARKRSEGASKFSDWKGLWAKEAASRKELICSPDVTTSKQDSEATVPNVKGKSPRAKERGYPSQVDSYRESFLTDRLDRDVLHKPALA